MKKIPIAIDGSDQSMRAVSTGSEIAAKLDTVAPIARDAGAAVIAITDSVQSPYGGIASNCFIVATESPQFFPSHVAPLVLIEGLMGMVVRRAGKQAVDRIRSTELAGHELQEYWVN